MYPVHFMFSIPMIRRGKNGTRRLAVSQRGRGREREREREGERERERERGREGGCSLDLRLSHVAKNSSGDCE